MSSAKTFAKTFYLVLAKLDLTQYGNQQLLTSQCSSMSTSGSACPS